MGNKKVGLELLLLRVHRQFEINTVSYWITVQITGELNTRTLQMKNESSAAL